jgi:hypothetical protein
MGSVRARLARPDLLVTTSHWELYVPNGYAYGRASTNMNLLVDGGRVTRDAMAKEMAAVDAALRSPNLAEPFRIDVPSKGVRYGFEMLYANHGDVDAYVSIPYTSRSGAALGEIVSLLGIFLAFVALKIWRASEPRLPFGPKVGAATAAVAALLVLVPIAVYGVSATPALVLALALVLLSARPELKRALERLRSSRIVEQKG